MVCEGFMQCALREGLRQSSPRPYRFSISFSLISNLQHLTSVFSHSCALFCTHQKLNSFVFMRLRTLCQKLPGVGYPSPREFFTRGPLHEEQNETTNC